MALRIGMGEAPTCVSVVHDTVVPTDHGGPSSVEVREWAATEKSFVSGGSGGPTVTDYEGNAVSLPNIEGTHCVRGHVGDMLIIGTHCEKGDIAVI